MKTLEEKIQKLSDKHKLSAKDAREIISDWSRQILELRAESEWLTHPSTMRVVELAEKRIEAIDYELANSRELSTEERNFLFAEKDTHSFYISSMTGNPETELRVLESRIDSEL